MVFSSPLYQSRPVQNNQSDGREGVMMDLRVVPPALMGVYFFTAYVAALPPPRRSREIQGSAPPREETYRHQGRDIHASQFPLGAYVP